MKKDPRDVEPSELEQMLQAQFDPNNTLRFASNAEPLAEAHVVKNLLLDDNSRGRLPLTRDSFVVNEDPARVEWERQVRKFLARLNGDFGHRITAVMIYEWATGIRVADLAASDEAQSSDSRNVRMYGSALAHLRKINWVLKEYFGTPYKTTIMGRSVGKAYIVRPAFHVRRKKPANLTLWPEYDEGTLNP